MTKTHLLKQMVEEKMIITNGNIDYCNDLLNRLNDQYFISIMPEDIKTDHMQRISEFQFEVEQQIYILSLLKQIQKELGE